MGSETGPSGASGFLEDTSEYSNCETTTVGNSLQLPKPQTILKTLSVFSAYLLITDI